jgi:hypothetical protein
MDLSKYFRVPSYVFMLLLSALLSVFFGFMYWYEDGSINPKEAALYAGFASAFLVAFFQLSTSILQALKLQKFETMGVKEILNARRGVEYYGDLIGSAKKEILVMGVTASRFMDDFGSDKTGKSELVNALSSGVQVKILIPKKRYLASVDKSNLTSITIPTYQNLKGRFEDKIELKYFDHVAAHSLVVIDDVCIAGPVFSGLKSKHTPAIVLESSSKYANPYLSYFQREWKSANEQG